MGEIVDRRHHPPSVDEVYDLSDEAPPLAEQAVGPNDTSAGSQSARPRTGLRFILTHRVDGGARAQRTESEAMTDMSRIDRLEVSVGGLSRTELRSLLTSRGVHLNAHAETLLDADVFERQDTSVITVTERTVAALGRPDGATLSEILKLGRERGLLLCPAETGPYLRLDLNNQAISADSVMSAGKAPDGSLTVASEALSEDVDYPKGFYLRVVDGQAWLRGYRCDDEHIWSADDRFVFRLPPGSE